MIFPLLIALQFSDASVSKRTETIQRMEELRHASEYEIAKKRDIKFRQDQLSAAHRDFILKFNIYIDKYVRGLNPIKERKAAIKAWNKLISMEDFDANR